MFLAIGCAELQVEMPQSCCLTLVFCLNLLGIDAAFQNPKHRLQQALCLGAVQLSVKHE